MRWFSLRFWASSNFFFISLFSLLRVGILFSIIIFIIFLFISSNVFTALPLCLHLGSLGADATRYTRGKLSRSVSISKMCTILEAVTRQSEWKKRERETKSNVADVCMQLFNWFHKHQTGFMHFMVFGVLRRCAVCIRYRATFGWVEFTAAGSVSYEFFAEREHAPTKINRRSVVGALDDCRGKINE